MTDRSFIIDRVCTCLQCEAAGEQGRYVMNGYCVNCGVRGLLGVFRVGDRVGGGYCPVCGVKDLTWVALADDQTVRP